MSRAEIAELEDPTELYECIEESRWAGMPNWLCPCCMHASLDHDEIVEHLRAWHIAPVLADRLSAVGVGVGLYDGNGKLITE